jgi:hypothetical protein
MNRFPRRLTSVCAALLGTLLLVGCENSFEPFAEEGAYSIYGYLSTERARQFIRVKPLNEPLDLSSAAPLGVTVTLENLTAGTATTLRDSVVVFEDENARSITHNFWTDAPIQPGAEYRITVDGPAGMTRATTLVPVDADPVVRPDSAGCIDTFSVAFLNADDLPLRGDIAFRYDGQRSTIRVLDDTPPTPDDPPTFEFTPELLLKDRVPFQEQTGNPCVYAPRCLALDDNEINISYVFTSPDWLDDPPELGEEFNPSLNQPDIENGVGFFGALRRDQFTVKVDTSELVLVGLDPNTCLDPYL